MLHEIAPPSLAQLSVPSRGEGTTKPTPAILYKKKPLVGKAPGAILCRPSRRCAGVGGEQRPAVPGPPTPLLNPTHWIPCATSQGGPSRYFKLQFRAPLHVDYHCWILFFNRGSSEG